MEALKRKIENLNLEEINIGEIEDNITYSVITIYGGFNGPANWNLYLWQIQGIVMALDAWVISLDNDCVDDVWTLKVGVLNE